MSLLRELRESQGKTQAEVAAAIGKTRSYIAQLELGLRQGTPDTLHKLAKFYGVSIETLLESSVPNNAPRGAALEAK